jgi:hypothetical protein
MKNSKGIEIWNRMFIYLIFLATPYAYFFYIRPKLKGLEERIDKKVTEIDSKTLDIIKSKQEALKKNKDDIKI